MLLLLSQGAGANKQALIELGEMVYPFTYALTDSDAEAVKHLEAVVALAQGEVGEVIRGTLTNPAFTTIILGAARWADQAYPQMVVGHKYAASMTVTILRDPAVIAEVRPPWKGFIVDVPPDMFPVNDELAGGTSHIIRALVRYKEDAKSPTGWSWTINAFTTGGVTFWRVHDTVGLLSEESKYLTPGEEAFAMTVDDRDVRSMLYLSRLVINLCLSFSDPEAVKPVGRARQHPNQVRRRGERIEPVVRVFQVGKPVNVDVREEVKDFLAHGRRAGHALTVQLLVSGHWKPRLAARVGHPVWVEPYWKGKEGAPIRVTPRRFKN